MNNLKVVIAEDSLVMRDLLERTLSKVEGLTIVGTAFDGDEAIRMVSELNPDVLISDILMPGQNGLEVLREVRKRDPTIRVIMFTGEPSLALRRICLESGASYYLEKSKLKELVEICKRVLRSR